MRNKQTLRDQYLFPLAAKVIQAEQITGHIEDLKLGHQQYDKEVFEKHGIPYFPEIIDTDTYIQKEVSGETRFRVQGYFIIKSAKNISEGQWKIIKHLVDNKCNWSAKDFSKVEGMVIFISSMCTWKRI